MVNPAVAPLDRPSGRGMTYRQMLKELDEDAKRLSEWEIEFVADGIDHPEKFVTDRQLGKIAELWERHFG